MARATAHHAQPAGSWRFRARRLFRSDLGLLSASLWFLCLLVAAIVATYAVAWAQCVVSPNQSANSDGRSQQGPLEVVRVTGSEPGVEHVWWSDSYGWPFRSVGALFEQVNSAGGGQGRIRMRSGIDLGARRDLRMSGLTVEWALPTVPVSGLFAVNVLFYFLVFSVICFGWVWRRDRRRLAGRRCIQCAYPLGGSDRCPECGQSEQSVARRGEQ